MSVATEKVLQGYTREAPCCARCAHFAMDTEEIRHISYSPRTWTREFNLRCTIGKFKVNKTAWCRCFDAAIRDAAATGEERDASDPKGDCL